MGDGKNVDTLRLWNEKKKGACRATRSSGSLYDRAGKVRDNKRSQARRGREDGGCIGDEQGGGKNEMEQLELKEKIINSLGGVSVKEQKGVNFANGEGNGMNVTKKGQTRATSKKPFAREISGSAKGKKREKQKIQTDRGE